MRPAQVETGAQVEEMQKSLAVESTELKTKNPKAEKLLNMTATLAEEEEQAKRR